MEAQSVQTETPAAGTAAQANATPAVPAVADEASVTRATPTADDIVEQRLMRIALEKKAIRDDKKAHKEALARADKLAKFEELKDSDPFAALEALGIDPDEYYLKATEAGTKRNTPADPKEVAKQAATDAIKEHEAAKLADATKRAEEAWTTSAYDVLDQFPGVTKALATGRIPMAEVTRLAWAMADAGQDTSPANVLKALEAHLTPKAATEVKPAPKAEAPPAALISNAPPVKPEGIDDLPFDEALAAAKAKHFKR